MTFGAIAAASAQTFTLTIQPNTLPPATSGVPYSQPITAVGGNSNYTLSVGSGSLPTGLFLVGSAGSYTISGTPSGGSGTFNFRIDAIDIDSNTGFRPYTFNTGSAGGMTVNPASLPDGFVGTSYSQTISGSGGTSPYSFTVTGSLPPGLTLSSGGALTGTPTTGGAFTFTVHGTDSGGNTGQRTYTVNIGAAILTVSPSSLPNGSVSSAYTHTVTASGGDGGPYTFALVSGTMPTGTTIDSAGNITGTPTTPGPYTFTIRATDGSSNIGNRTYTVTIGSNILTVTPPTQPNGTVGNAYSQNFGATGGNGSYTFARTSGTLPTGLTLSSGGTLSGLPSASGTFNFDITATDTNFNTGTRSYTIVINLAPLTISPSSLPAGTVSTSYSSGVSASGGSGNYSYAIVSGGLPNGLTMSPSTGAITGTPTTSGPFNFTVQATDNTTPNTGTRAYTINIGTGGALTLTPTTLPNGTQGTGYNQTVSATGATGSVSFALTSGTLPANLTISSGGVISGTPSGSGSSTFTIMGTDSIGNTGSQVYTVNIGTNTLVVTPATLPVGTRTLHYSQNVGATGGTGGPYTFTISVGSLPAGLTMNSAGLISGTPTAGGSTFTVRALDGQGNFGTRIYTLGIGTVTLTVNPPTLPAPVVGSPYSQTVTATGGTGPYIFTISGGALPPGLTISSGGVISGTPTSNGSASFTVQARDVNGNIGTRLYSLTSRANPALDPEVQGIITSQVATAQRFASTQVSNITRHLETLHEHFTPCGFNFGIAPAANGGPPEFGAPYSPQSGPQGYGDPNALYSPNGQYGAPVRQERGPLGYAGEPLSSNVGPFASGKRDPLTRDADLMTTGADYRLAPPPPQRQPPRLPPCSSDWLTNMAFWTSGSIQFGHMTPTGSQDGNKFNTSGLTAGVDIRPTDSLIVGIAVGYGVDRSDIGSSGSRSDSTSLSAALYACMTLFNPFFLDAALGYGNLGYDNKRFVTADGTFADGTRKGSYWFGALKLSADLVQGRIKFTPYVSVDFTSTTLDSYSEQGSTAQLLSYDSMKFTALSGTVGLRGSIDIPMTFGTLTPNARVEYRQTSQSSYDQALYYTDLGSGSSSTFGQASGVRNLTTGSLGLRARSPGGLGVELEYSLSVGSNSFQSQTIRGGMRVPF